jgi:hypothetical protein
MDKKQTPADRTKRQPRDPSPERKHSWNPADDIYGNDGHAVDTDLDLDKGKYSEPPPKR